MSLLDRRWLIAAILLLPKGAWAHSISLVQGEALVRRDKVEVRLDIRPEDVLLSAGMPLLVPGIISKDDLMRGAENHRQYLLNGLCILDAAGKRLSGTIVRIESPPIPDAGIPLDQLMTTSFLYEIDYPLAEPPARLGFRQQFQTDRNPIPVSMQLTVRREGQDSGLTIPIPGGDSAEYITFQWENKAPPSVQTHYGNYPENFIARYLLFLASTARGIQARMLMPASNFWLIMAWAILLGALHGLEPGHSKGLMTAFVIGTRGSFGQAIVLALSATISHTAIVWLLAWPASYGGAIWLGNDVGPYLNLISGVVILALSLWMLRRTSGSRHAHFHDHEHGHGHGHPHTHSHEAPDMDDAHARAHEREIARRFSGRSVTTLQVIVFGLGSGLAPCTAAVVILLGCFRLHQLWMGFALVMAFSIGLGLTLAAVAVVATWGGRIIGSRWTRLEQITRKAPKLSALATAVIGVYFIVQFFRSNLWVK